MRRAFDLESSPIGSGVYYHTVPHWTGMEQEQHWTYIIRLHGFCLMQTVLVRN